MRRSFKTFFLWAVLILLFFSFYSIFSRQRATDRLEDLRERSRLARFLGHLSELPGRTVKHAS